MATVTSGVWGIDLGQCALKALRLEQGDDGQVVATAFDYVEHPKILSQPDADPDQLTRAALEQFLSRNDLRGDEVAISVPGQTGLARFVKLPPVEPKKIPDIVRFEATQQIPFPLDEVVWDWQTIGGDAPAGEFVENEIGLFAMKRDMVNRYLQAFKDVDVEIHHVQMTTLALCNFLAYDLIGRGAPGTDGTPAKQCVVAVDIGADNTSLIITDGAKVIWQRPIPIGGNHFTRALTKDLKLTFSKAEHLKRNAIKAEDPKKIFQAMKPVFSDFVGEVKRSLGFFTNTHRDAKVVRMIGLGNAFKLPGLQKFLSQNLDMELEKLPAYQRLSGPDEVMKSPVFADNLLSFSVAYGLALQGLGSAQLKTNLLPQDIQFERVIRAKKPWLTTAAASLFLGTAALLLLLSGKYQDAAEAAQQAREASAKKKAEELKTQFKDRQDKLKDALQSAAAVLKGEEDRKTWIWIHRYINDAMPQANGYNVPNKFWTEDAKKNGESKRLRDRENVKQEDLDLRYLTQVSIEGVYTRYCDVALAKTYFDRVSKNSTDRTSLRMGPEFNKEVLDPDWKKGPPTEPGHAVEIWGYTYHHAKEAFVREAVVQNLREYAKDWANPNLFWKRPENVPFSSTAPIKISHVAVYRVEVDDNYDPKVRSFKLLHQGYLNEIFGGGAGGGAAGGVAGAGAGGIPQPGVPPGAGDAGGGGGSRKPFTGLGGSFGSGAGGGGFGAPPGGGGAGIPPGGGGGGASPPIPPAGGPPTPMGGFGGGASPPVPPGGGNRPTDSTVESKKLPRTEFVIVFYWIPPEEWQPTKDDIGGSSSDPRAPPGDDQYRNEFPEGSADGTRGKPPEAGMP